MSKFKAGQTESIDNWKIVHKDKYGNIKDTDVISNRIVDEGLDYTLDAALNGNGVSEWYIGLISGDPTVAASDTLSSHPGWIEITQYDATTRNTWNSGSVVNQQITNEGNPATFIFNEDGLTVGGAMLVSNNTKGGTTGILYAAGAFEKGNKLFDEGDVIEVTAEFGNSYDEE